MLTRQEPGIREENLFAAAIALPAAERSAYLRRACDTKPDLLERLTALIEVSSTAASFVAESPVCAWDSADRIGPYRVISELGEGGCGVAYHAEQTTPVRREVAIKVIKPGMDTKAVIARFEAERQALALMDHPNVARVFDAGTTNEGRPYFVMELVRGIRITEFCDQSRMTVPERLSLFTQVCQAIQHAHQKGIIHRDIKPSNILVTVHDGFPIAKVIDFGIAKAIRGRLTDRTLHTEVDQVMGTPAYISPEQAEPGQAAVDTRSDIYSLGVVLYELLTGRTPFDAPDPASASIQQLRERLRTHEPLRPSRRLSLLDEESLFRISRASGATASKLVKQVRDELDWIVMQCLEKEPARRYQTVHELILDVDRHLRHESILARPPSLTYAVRKLARRNRGLFASALTFIIVITSFAVAMTIQAQRIANERDQAKRERQEAQRVSNVAMHVFAIADPYQSFTEGGINAPAVLDQAAKSIERELRDQPAPRARLLRALGLAYFRRDQFKSATTCLTEASNIFRSMPGAGSEALEAMVDLSMALRNGGDLPRARAVLSNAEDLAKRHGLLHSAGYARLVLNRARSSLYEGRTAVARAEFEMSLHLYLSIVGPRRIEVAEVMGDLSQALLWADDVAQAEKNAREAIAIFEKTAPALYPDRIATESTLAEALYMQNRLDESAVLLASALRKNIEVFGPNSVAAINTLDRLALVKYGEGKLREAEAYSRDAVAKSRITFGEKHYATALWSTALARTLAAQGRYEEAQSVLKEALDTLRTTLDADHQYIASGEYFLGELLLSTNRLTEAESVLTASMNRWKRGDAPPWRAMRSANALGEALYRQGHTAEGTKYLSESLRELSTDPKADREAKDKARARAKRYLGTKPAAT